MLDQRADLITKHGEAVTAESGARGVLRGLDQGDFHLAALPLSLQASSGSLWLLEVLEMSDPQVAR